MTLTPPPSQQTPNSPHRTPNRRVLIVENYCHDVLNQNGTVVAETLGGAASSISNVLDSSFFSCDLISNRRSRGPGEGDHGLPSLFRARNRPLRSVTGIAQPSGSDKLYTASTDETLRIWDCASGHLLRNLFLAMSYSLSCGWTGRDLGSTRCQQEESQVPLIIIQTPDSKKYLKANVVVDQIESWMKDFKVSFSLQTSS
ncbi:unnamed protein product [Brassica oleracea var. botrytis]|uniref:Uncharacterized protein n=1 Tax=Brassica oleracea TaxID=3712 RepID=A0A3P6BJJ4_BRAOL|nr:unnamed protein product [Brassica oleracea]